MDVDNPKEKAKGPPDIPRSVAKSGRPRNPQRAKLSATRRHVTSATSSSSSSSSSSSISSPAFPSTPESSLSGVHSLAGPLSVPQIVGGGAAHIPPPAHSRIRTPSTQPGILGKFHRVVPVAAGPRPDLRDAPLDLSWDSSSTVSAMPPPAHGNTVKGRATAKASTSGEAPLDLSVKKRPASHSESGFLHEPAPKKLAVDAYPSDTLSPNVNTYNACESSTYKASGSGCKQSYESRTWVSSYGKPKVTPVGIATATAHSYEKLDNTNVKSTWATPLPPAPGPSKITSPLDGISLSSRPLVKVSKPSKSSAAHVPPVRRRSPILPVGKYAVTSTEHPPEVVNVRGKAFKVSTVRPQVNGQPVITTKSYNPVASTSLVSRPFSVGGAPDATMGVNATIGAGPLGCLRLNPVATSLNSNRQSAAASISSKPLERPGVQRDESVTVEAGGSSTTYIPSETSTQKHHSRAQRVSQDSELDYQAPLLNIPKFRPSKKKSKKSTNVQVKTHIPDSQPDPGTLPIAASSSIQETPDDAAEGRAGDEELSPACVSISTQTIEPQTFNYPPPDEPVDFNDLYPRPSRTVMCARKSTTKPSKRLLQQYLELRSPTKMSVMNHGKKSSSSNAMETTSSPSLPSPNSCLSPSPCCSQVGDTIKKEPNPAFDTKGTSSKQSTGSPAMWAGTTNRENCDGFKTVPNKSKLHSVNKKGHSVSKSIGTDTELERTSYPSQSPHSSSSSKSLSLPTSHYERNHPHTISQAEKSASSSSSSSPAHIATSVKPLLSKISFEPLVINMDDSCDSQASSSCASSINSGVSKWSAPEADTGRLLARLLVAKHEQKMRGQSPGRESPRFHGMNSPKVDQLHHTTSTHSSDADLEVEHISSGEERVSRPRGRKFRSDSSDACSQGNIFDKIRAMASKNRSTPDPELKEELSLMCFEEMSPESAPPSPSGDQYEKASDNSELSFNQIFNKKVLELSSDAESKDIPDDTAVKDFKSEDDLPPKIYPKVANLSAFISTVENKLVPLHYASIRESIHTPAARTTSPVPIENTRFYQANILRGSLNRSTSTSALESMNTATKLESPAQSSSQSATSSPIPSPTMEEENLEEWQREHIRYKRHKLRMPRELIALPKSLRKGGSKRLSPEGLYDHSPSTQYGKAKACISTDSHTPVLTPIRSLSTTSVKGLSRLANLDASLLRTVPKSVRTVADFNRARELAVTDSVPDLSKEFATDPMETWTMVKEVSPRKPVSPAAASGKESSGTLVTVLRRERSRDDSSSSKSPVPFIRRKSIDAQFLLAKPSTSKQDLEPTEAHSVASSDTSESPKPKITFTYNEGKPVIKISHPKKKSSKSSKPEKHRRFSYTIKGDPIEPPSEPRDPCSPPPKLSPIRLIASPPRKSKKSSKKSDTPPADNTSRPMYSASSPDLTPISSEPVRSKVKSDVDNDVKDFSAYNFENFPMPSSNNSTSMLPITPKLTSQKVIKKETEAVFVDASPPKIPKLEPQTEKKPPKRQRSPIKMTLKSPKDSLNACDNSVAKKTPKSKQSPHVFPSPCSSKSTSDVGDKGLDSLSVTKTPPKASSEAKLEKKLKKTSKKHKKNKKRDGSKERSKGSEGKKIKKESGERDGSKSDQHKVKKSSKKKKKSDKKESGESKKKSSAITNAGEIKVKSKEKSSERSKSKSDGVKDKTKKRTKKDKSNLGETSAERKRRYHKRMKARNLGKKIKQAERERDEEEQKRKKKRRSLLDELANSDGYVAEKRLEEKKSKDLFADPSKLGREERALLRAMMQFSEMEQVSEVEQKSDDKMSDPEGSKRQDQISAVRKAQALRKSALKRARSKKGMSTRKKFDDFVPEILSTRTRRQAADKKSQLKELPSKGTPAQKVGSLTKENNKREILETQVKDEEKIALVEVNPNEHSGRWEILSDDDQRPSPQSPKCQVSPTSGLTLTIQWKPRPAEENEVSVKPEPISRKCRTPDTKRRKSRGRRMVTGYASSNVGDEEHSSDLRHDPLDLDIPLASLREQLCAPSPVPSVTSFTTVSTSCTDELPVPECVKKMSVNQNTGETILHKAARLGYEDVARFCAQTEYLDLDARDHAGYTAMHECCSQGHLEVTKLLIDGGASVNIPSCDGMRPLHDAVENDLTEMVRLLLSRGADPKVATYSGKTVLGLTTEKEMLSLLTGHFQDLNGCRQPQPEIPWPFHGSSVCEVFHELAEGQGMDVLDDTPLEDAEESIENMFEFSDAPMVPTYFLPLDPVKGATNYILLDDISDHLGMTPEAFLQEHFTVMLHYCSMDYITSRCTCLCPSALTRLKTISEQNGDRVRLVEYTDEMRSLLGIGAEPFAELKSEQPVETFPTSASQDSTETSVLQCKLEKESSEEGLSRHGVWDSADSRGYDWNEQFLIGTQREKGSVGNEAPSTGTITGVKVGAGSEGVRTKAGGDAIFKGLFLHAEEEDEDDLYITAMGLDTKVRLEPPRKNDNDIHFKKPY